jgi:predicted 2-oxoglutarate/Fe(II)-dependent dioxygenase YbiX
LDAQVFAHFGLFVRKGFLTPDLCRRLADDVRRSASHRATIRDGGRQLVDEKYRSTHIVDVSEASHSLVRASVEALKPELEQHFDVTTSGCREPEFLAYRKGDFFAPHADSVRAGHARDDVVTGRRISVVIFLNGESDTAADGRYVGGALEFYGLLDDPRMKERAMSLSGEEGLLVAFLPDVIHSVAPVVEGERYSVVTWFDA